MTPPATSRIPIVVIGGGLIGCSTARALAAEGHAVLLLERDEEPGRRATSAAAGMLAPQMEAARHERALAASPAAEGSMRALSIASRSMYRDFVRILEAESGRSIPYRDDGTLVVALDEEGREELRGVAERQRTIGLAAELLDGGAAREVEPALDPAVVAALHLPDDHAVDNVALARAALEAAAVRGVEIETGRPVDAVEIDGGRVVGVRVGERSVEAPVVVVAAGAWSGRLAGLPRVLPVRPVRGQIGAVALPAPPRLTVAGPGAYCVPRDDDRVLIGATVEEVGFDHLPREGAVRELVEAAARFLPGLVEGGDLETWSGLRPGTPDDLPVLGADPDAEGLLYATGHFRNGILLAPVTAATIAALVSGRSPPVAIDAFRPDRFAA
ncbi:MAG: glycine oxidase ThiO [Gemmatimonadetes bacterium]|nr:glycine oxidase ThiO [Gemmatimonadota bacterium]